MATSIPFPDSKELTAWRHDFHQHPETAFEEQRTSARIAALLGEWGFEVTTGIAGTGVVAALDGQQGEGKTIGLRADIDALEVQHRDHLQGLIVGKYGISEIGAGELQFHGSSFAFCRAVQARRIRTTRSC